MVPYGTPMKMTRQRWLLAVLLLVALPALLCDVLLAQCSMCKTVLEGSSEGRSWATGFNRGILFLLSIPFLVFGTVTLLIVRSVRSSSRRSPAELRMTRDASTMM